MEERRRKWWWKGVCIFGVALALTFLLTTPVFAWWDADWKYRRAITIQSDNALTDYQILVQLNSTNFDFSKANPDGSDIRFVDEDDTTKLSYWIEEWNASSQTAKIWVKVPSIPAGEKTIYLYYNNSNAVSESDGDAVFDFFDDFEGTSLDASKWNLVKGTEGSNVFVENGELKVTSNAVLIQSIKSFSQGYLLESKHRIISYAGYGHIIHGFRETTSKNAEHLIFASNNRLYADGSATGGSYAVPTDTYHLFQVKVKDNTAKAEIYDMSGNQKDSISGTATFSSAVITLVERPESCTSGSMDARWDWIRVRKYTEPEPSVSVGAEELPPPIEVTCISPTTLQIKLFFTEKSGHVFIGTSPDKFTYAYEFHGSGTYTLTTTFLLPNETYYIKACDIDGDCTDVVEFVCSKETELEKKNFTAPFNNLMQGGNLLNISKLGETIPSVYTSLLTDMFWAMFFGGIFLAYWIRQEDVMLPSIVGMISGVAMIGLLPPSAQHVAYILLVISIAGTLYTIIKARR